MSELLLPETTACQPAALSEQLRRRLRDFVAPLLTELDACLDARLVRTFLATLEVILVWRHRQHGLLLSELGAYLLGPAHAPAGTKRLSNLLRSSRWSAEWVARFHWRRADARVHELEGQGLVIWDESVVEKPESVQGEGLCAVRSSKAARLTRVKPGFYGPPRGGSVFVPGVNWLCLLVLGPAGPPTVATMRWWTRRGGAAQPAQTLRELQRELLAHCAQLWGRAVLHVWDRGYVGGPWLGEALAHGVRFVVRWPKRWGLETSQGTLRPAWQHARGKRSWESRQWREPRRRMSRKVDVLAVRVTHAEHTAPLWLVVARSGGGREPWYLLTNEPIETVADAWRVVEAYARRWQIELTFRYGKSELALESPRLWTWERRLKLFWLVTLVYAFLLSLLDPTLAGWCEQVLRGFCHRTGRRLREVAQPLYRLRSALSHLLRHYPGIPPGYQTQNSG